MRTGQTAEGAFRWRSWLGLAVVLFLLYGAFNLFAAIQVPLTLHAKGAGGTMGTLIVSAGADAKVLGRPLATLAQSDPAQSDFLVAFMDTMCMMMMAFAVLQMGMAWFALRRGHAWALWTMAIADLSFIPYLLAWGSIYSRYGVTLGDNLTSFGGFWFILPAGVIVATLAGWFGMRQSSTASAR